jgi:S-DNA-T family DNA segregation ATPase FtsK/SpoIIIE
MGNNAVRSQMDVRICLRVRERRDVDLIIGQGSFNSGWHAHTLTQPGTFMISAPEHVTPERARAYLISDGQVTAQAAQHARPHHARETASPAWRSAALRWPHSPEGSQALADDRPGADTALWAALRDAGPEGVTVAQLLALTGMTRPTLYRRLRAHAQAGQVVQTLRGSWRATGPPDSGGR